ncbi:voltage-dependent calcium channel subunit alpha-2/delta-2-like isoform X2 [Ischnura elegans]|uniref:voltage-dependent calcium channel subunit alpha-2/delta-2-like isoform X2 n=1 Tax=Ischnura elegans TaxID=197161 RepID=UPI001ED88096|nr:voltage-dependent calcium channel subunit alpha-2/delta-2-like isoform X2 [Ischnura elegans]
MMEYCKVICHVFQILTYSQLWIVSQSKELPDTQTLSKWNFMLESQLTRLLTSVTGVDVLRENYKDSQNLELKEVDGMHLLNEAIPKMAEVLMKKEEAVKRLVKAAETAVADHRENPALSLDNVKFLNMKEIKKYDDRLQNSSRFMQSVSFNESGVHIPLEIYEGWMGPRYKVVWWHDPQILNGLKWTSALNEAFEENVRLDPSLRWQYFGSQRGFMRVYPAFRWPDIPNLPDLFDVRRQSWYIQGSVSPKDIVILIDVSGSVHGQTFDIMKIAVKTLLNTLGEDDYVNVAWFNNEVDWVIPCLNTLVQATSYHKGLLYDAVDQLQEGNLTSYATALEFAFEAFRKFEERKRPWEGSDCHKVIMFFSDGGTEWPEEILNHYRNDSITENVRIFTYACGPHPIPTVILKTIACETKGYFNTITALGAIRTRIQDYVRILSRPLVISGNQELFQWTNFYKDSGGLGFVATITLPVANRSAANENQTLLGVMGIDVALSELTSLIPYQNLGHIGYGFSINTNGFVVFHPLLERQVIDSEDAADVDLMELEGHSVDMEKIRYEMIDGKTGSSSLVSATVIIDERYSLPLRMNYYYGTIGESKFRLGLAVPEGHIFGKVSYNNFRDNLNFVYPDGVLLAPWKFCEEGMQLQNLSSFVTESMQSCDSILVQHLMWDVKNTRNLWTEWQKANKSIIFNRFVFTTGGLTMVYPSSEVNHYTYLRDPKHNPIYKRASFKKGYIFSVMESTRYGIKSKTVHVSTKVTVEKDGKSYVAAVVGAEIGKHVVQMAFLNITGKANGENLSCGFTDDLRCYLLDDAGFIIASNQLDVEVGTFLGRADPQLMTELVDKSMYEKIDRYNFHARCVREEDSVTTGAPALSPSIPHLLMHMFSSLWSTSWVFDVSQLFSFLQYVFASFIVGSMPAYAGAQLEYGWEPTRVDQACTTKASWYAHTGKLNYAGAFQCDNCSRPLRAAFLPNLTLVFVVAGPPCSCLMPTHYLNQLPVEDPGPDWCAYKKMFRVKPLMCYANTEKENATDCGSGASQFSGSSFAFLCCFFVTIVIYSQTFFGNSKMKIQH